MAERKKRLDLILVERGMAQSRQRARALIMAGKVLVDGSPFEKPGVLVAESRSIVLRGTDHPYVSRGGLKLEAAIRAIGLDLRGMVCLDVGSATGGFTDCLLQHGAGRVFAVDVGYGQLAWKLRQNPRVVTIERTNIRYMPFDALPCDVDLVTIDTSFISLKLVVPAVRKFMKKSAGILALVKPQFEIGRGRVGKGGVIRDPVLHHAVIEELSEFFKKDGLLVNTPVPSPILGPKGNREFLLYLTADSPVF